MNLRAVVSHIRQETKEKFLVRAIVYLIRREIKKIFLKLQYGSRIHIGKKVGFRKNVKFYLEKSADLTIGDGCFFNNDCSINVQNEVKIGRDTLFGEGVRLYDHNHVFTSKDIPIAKQGFRTDPISIGSNCWICSNVVILKGVHIGNNCVIGAGCVIAHNIPDDTIVKCTQQLQVEERRQTGA